jgi:hypothetical protein
MDTVVVVEVLDRVGKVKERHRIDHFPFNIGRSYHNDLILDDGYVSPEHLVVDLDEHQDIVVRDNDSTNGLFTLHPLTQHETIAVEDDTRLRIGHTDLRFRFPHHAVKETVLERNKPSRLIMIATNTLLLPVVWALTAAALLGIWYLSSTEEVSVNALLRDALNIFIFIAAWAFAWSIASKVVTHRFFYAFHAIWISLLIVASTVIEYVAEYVEFVFGTDGLADWITVVTGLALVGLLFYGHLRYSSVFSKQRTRNISAAAAVILVAVVQLIMVLSEPEFSNKPHYSTVVKPPAFVLREPVSMEQFFDHELSVKDFDSSAQAAGDDAQ